jgi:predicted small lipoprotein YifL
MSMRIVSLLIGLSLVAGASCGRKGPLALPQGQAPMAVERLSAVAKDGTVVLTWENPVKTVSGKPLGPLGEIEIWVFERNAPAAGASVRPDAVEASARLVRRIAVKDAAVSSFVFEPSPAGPNSLAFTVRVLDRKGRASDFSPPAVAEIVRAPAGTLASSRRGT